MISEKVSFVVILLVWFSVSSNCQFPVRDCDVTSWTFRSRCTSDQCGQLGAQSRSRMIVTRPTCGERECPDDLFETRQCYGGNPVDCELSQWTSWSSCTTPCGASGTQSSSRHRVLTEKCGGTCSSSLSRTRSCLQTSCFNGGSVQNGACRCRDGFTGNCCQGNLLKRKEKHTQAHLNFGSLFWTENLRTNFLLWYAYFEKYFGPKMENRDGQNRTMFKTGQSGTTRPSLLESAL